MTTEPKPTPESSFTGRLLQRFDRLPFMGGGRTQIVFLGLFFAIALSGYMTVLKLRGGCAQIVTWTTWDEAFPFNKAWTWVYLIPYVFGPALVGTLRRNAFIWYVQRATWLVLISITIFAIMPTMIKRPIVEREEGLTEFLYRNMVEIDEPAANAAPSLHVSLSCLLAWAIAYDRPRWGVVAFLGAIVVWLSTLYTAQHHLIDVATGVILASLVAIGGPRRSEGTRPGSA